MYRGFDIGDLTCRLPRLAYHGWSSQHEGIGQQIEVETRRRRTHSERPGGFRRIPKLPVVMGNHGPESKQGNCRHTQAV
jgi:hypothetical protein